MNDFARRLHVGIAVVLTTLSIACAHAQTPFPPADGYEHDKWKTEPKDTFRTFEAFVSSFDSKDDNDGDGEGEAWGIPEWVAYEIKGGTDNHPSSRPSKWDTEAALHSTGIAPNDDTYAVSGTGDMPEVKGNFRFVRGHMCPKETAQRISVDAAVHTHTVLNAVPQLQCQNNGVWKKLEELCLDWADAYDSVWVVCGPVFFGKEPAMWLGQSDEVRAAIPDALFKIVIAENGDSLDVLAYLIPNILPGSESDPEEFLTTVDRIEELTGLDFLTALDDAKEDPIEESQGEQAEW